MSSLDKDKGIHDAYQEATRNVQSLHKDPIGFTNYNPTSQTEQV